MTTETKRPNILLSLLLLVVTIAVGAHISGIPFLLFKAGVVPVLVLAYGYFALRIITPMRIGSTGPRVFLGLLLGAATLYITWAIRIPAFSGWDTAFTLSPQLLFDSIMHRAGSMEVSRGFGRGMSAEGPSWLMLTMYTLEAVVFVGVMVLCAQLAGPDGGKAEKGEENAEEPAREAA